MLPKDFLPFSRVLNSLLLVAGHGVLRFVENTLVMAAWEGEAGLLAGIIEPDKITARDVAT